MASAPACFCRRARFVLKNMNNKLIKIAIVGVGHWGKKLLKEFDKQAEVVWCCHRGSAESVKFLAENYPNIKTTTSLEDILNDSSVEAVVVATPTNTHFDIAQKVIMANKHLFLEKPGCSKPSELKQLCEETEKRKLIFAVGYEFVHHPALKKIKELIKLEDIKGLCFEWHKWGTFEAPIVPHLLSHDISIIKSLGINSLKPKNYRGQKIISDVDIIEVEFENDKNIPITNYINRASTLKNKNITIIGADRSYIWNNDNLFKIEPGKQTYSSINMVKNSSLAEEIKDFLESIKGTKKLLCDGRFALDIWEVVGKIIN